MTYPRPTPTETFNATYGASKNKCIIFAYTHQFGNEYGHTWYVVEGSVNVHKTITELHDDIDVETTQDIDFFTNGTPIESEEQLQRECDEFEDDDV